MNFNKISNALFPSTLFAVLLLAAMSPSDAKGEHASFKDEVFPILKTNCLSCHQPGGAGYEISGLNMNTYENLMKGSKYGPMIIPGDAFTSNLMVLIEGRASKTIKMPHGSYRQEPTKNDRRLIRAWINAGAINSTAFKRKVFPILEKYCHECHQPGSAGYEMSGFDIRTYDSLMKGAKLGSVIVPGDAFTSNLMVLIEGRSKFGLKMPHVDNRALSKREKHLIRAWIKRGALNN